MSKISHSSLSVSKISYIRFYRLKPTKKNREMADAFIRQIYFSVLEAKNSTNVGNVICLVDVSRSKYSRALFRSHRAMMHLFNYCYFLPSAPLCFPSGINKWRIVIIGCLWTANNQFRIYTQLTIIIIANFLEKFSISIRRCSVWEWNGVKMACMWYSNKS